VFAKLAVVGTKGGAKMGVDVQFASNFTVDENRYDDFRFGLEGTGQVAPVGSNVVNDNGFTCRRRRPADPLIEWDAVCGVMVPWKGPRTSMSRSASLSSI
jgi:hypothetical protein